jgi:hypothetical protein
MSISKKDKLLKRLKNSVFLNPNGSNSKLLEKLFNETLNEILKHQGSYPFYSDFSFDNWPKSETQNFKFPSNSFSFIGCENRKFTR